MSGVVPPAGADRYGRPGEDLRAPVAADRLQLGPAFGFAPARAVIPYLQALGAGVGGQTALVVAPAAPPVWSDGLTLAKRRAERGPAGQRLALAEGVERRPVALLHGTG